MLRTHVSGHARFVARQFGRGAFVGLLGLALAVATVSFLTACRCTYPFIGPEPTAVPPVKDETPPADRPPPPPILIPPIPSGDTKAP